MPVEVILQEDSENMVVEASSISSMVVHSQTPAMLVNLSFSNIVQNRSRAGQNAISSQQSVNQVGVSTLGQTVAIVQGISAQEAISAQNILTGNEMAEAIANLKAATGNLNPHPPMPGPLPPLPPNGILYAEVPLYLVYDRRENVRFKPLVAR